MAESQQNNPDHGVKLVDKLEFLVEKVGWNGLAGEIAVRCFMFDPSIKSSLKFLRKTPWAKEKIEKLYLDSID